jgi:serine/threonine protein kinase
MICCRQGISAHKLYLNTDIKLDNIQMTLPDPEDETLQSFVRAEKEQPSFVSRKEGSLIYSSREMQQDELGYPILCDLGSAVIASSPSRGLIQALPYRAPEVILGANWDAKVDVWNVGVLVSFHQSTQSLC